MAFGSRVQILDEAVDVFLCAHDPGKKHKYICFLPHL